MTGRPALSMLVDPLGLGSQEVARSPRPRRIAQQGVGFADQVAEEMGKRATRAGPRGASPPRRGRSGDRA